MIMEERIMRVHTLLRLALNDDLSIAETAKRVKQLFGADWGLTRAELDEIIDHRVRVLQDERRRLDLQVATLTQVRDQAVAESKRTTCPELPLTEERTEYLTFADGSEMEINAQMRRDSREVYARACASAVSRRMANASAVGTGGPTK